MTDEYTKTVVIRDSDYQPGQLYPTPRKNPNSKDGNETIEDGRVPMDYPSFEDTSWLT